MYKNKNCFITQSCTKHQGFTLAEILITLTIIAVLAAILFPSILANYTEKTLKAKRQALFGRMSQAMGEMADQFGNYEAVSCTNNNDRTTCTDEGSALKFINEGLSKVYKLAAVCDNETLSACDIPDTITLESGKEYSIKDNAQSLTGYNRMISKNADILPFDTKTAGFMTKNGESILLFYNPSCGSKDKSERPDMSVFTTGKLCVNMIYDLNGGKKKPNKMGEDIGYMSVFYSDMPYVVSPRPLDWRTIPDYDGTTDSSDNVYATKWNISMNHSAAQAACAALGDNIGLPSREEGMAMQINRELWSPQEEEQLAGSGNDHIKFWTSTMSKPNYAWRIELHGKNRRENSDNTYAYLSSTENTELNTARCVYKD